MNYWYRENDLSYLQVDREYKNRLKKKLTHKKKFKINNFMNIYKLKLKCLILIIIIIIFF